MACTCKAENSTIASPSYANFEPYCERREVNGVETLIICLPDFKRDQLRVQVNNQGVLKISGERPIVETHKRRFLKEIKTPKDCDTNEVRAKFTNGKLHVTMPKKVGIEALETLIITEPCDHMFGLGSSLARLQMGEKVPVSLGIAIIALVAIGSYAAYKCGSASSSSSSTTSARIKE